MKPARKRVSFTEIRSDAKEGLKELVNFDKLRAYFDLVQTRLQDLPKTNYDLGYRFAGEGKWTDAIFRFKVTLYLKSDYPLANYNLGCCYMRTGETAKARAAFLKALKQSPGNPEVSFMLASLDPAAMPATQRPVRMPMDMVTGFFSNQAAGYDIAEANNQYQAGKVIYDLARPQVDAAAPAILDLGCGSGIAARPWRAGAASIHGVDVTPAMLALADKATHADKKLFDRLTNADISQLGPDVADGRADLVLLVNVVQFIGELNGVLRGAAQALKPDGVLVITTEPYADSGFGLVAATSRFGHSNAYVKQIAAAVGLMPLSESTVELYSGVPAQALIFSKGTHA